ncbi:MAG: hypothetical protein KF784_14030 [Fimbriimonadaceae bacterium]|nr:hypothetical protein [Fimbriimonadaceae bacterium]
MCLCIVAVPALLAPVFMTARESALRNGAMGNGKRIITGLQIYSLDNNDLLPPGDTWMDASSSFVGRDSYFRSPAVGRRGSSTFGFALREEFAGTALPKIKEPEKEPLVFDSTILLWNAVAGLDTLPKPGRYSKEGARLNIIVYADGSAKQVPDSQDPHVIAP